MEGDTTMEGDATTVVVVGVEVMQVAAAMLTCVAAAMGLTAGGGEREGRNVASTIIQVFFAVPI